MKLNINKRKVFVVAIALCLLATVSLGTLAWFTAQDSVTNEFFVGDSTTEPDEVFGVDVWETVDGTEYGKGTANDTGATYEDILPGQALSKEPVVENTGIHSMFVRAIVTVSGADVLKSTMAADLSDAAQLFGGNDSSKWLLDSVSYDSANDGTLTYVYYYQSTLAADTTSSAIFTTVNVPTALTTEMAAELDSFEVNVLAQAIQSEHIGYTTAKAAFEAIW